MLNVLLMLSTRQPPDPRTEIAWHYNECQRTGSTWLVTTRRLSPRLQPGKSTVAFYGDAALGNAYLGRGMLLQYALIGTPTGTSALARSPLYQQHGYPVGAQGLIELSAVTPGRPGDTLDILGGTIETSGMPLTIANVPRSAARIQVYYRS